MRFKQDFPIFSRKVNGHDLIYLDNGATTQRPKSVIEAEVNFISNNYSNVHRGIHTLSEESTNMYEDAHKKVSNFINAKFSEVVFTSGTTDGINMIADMLEDQLKEGDEIVLTEMEHHSNIVPWLKLAERKNLIIRYIPLKGFELDYDVAKEIINSKTKIVALTHISNVLGTINNIELITKFARENGAYVVVDGAQSAPHIKIDVKKMNVDFFVFSAHKMLGPTGIGALYGKYEILNKLNPRRYGGGMIEKVTKQKATWHELPYRLEAGTPRISQAVGFAAAIDYLENIGMEEIEKYEYELTEYALEKLKSIDQLKIIGNNENKNRSSVITFTIDGMHPHDISSVLNEYGIAVRSGHHCAQPLSNQIHIESSTRASLYFYNTKEDIDALTNALKKAGDLLK